MSIELARQQKSLAFMKDPINWPRWPVLPVKRNLGYAPEPTIGIMFAVEEHLTTVFIGPLFGLKGPKISDAIAQCEVYKVYPDYEGIIDDGWVVD